MSNWPNFIWHQLLSFQLKLSHLYWLSYCTFIDHVHCLEDIELHGPRHWFIYKRAWAQVRSETCGLEFHCFLLAWYLSCWLVTWDQDDANLEDKKYYPCEPKWNYSSSPACGMSPIWIGKPCTGLSPKLTLQYSCCSSDMSFIDFSLQDVKILGFQRGTLKSSLDGLCSENACFVFFLWVFFQKLYWEAAIPCWLFEVSKCLVLDRWNSWCLVYPGSVSSLATPPEEQCQVLSLHCLLPKPRSYLQAGGDRGTVVAFNCRRATS